LRALGSTSGIGTHEASSRAMGSKTRRMSPIFARSLLRVTSLPGPTADTVAP
jgi:hypothetical protein